MKILCLIDGAIQPGHRWLWKYLPSSDDELDFLVTTGGTDRFAKWGKLINYYPIFLRTGFRALLKTRKTDYDAVVAWEGKNGFPYALVRSIVRQKSPPLIIAAFNIRGVISHFPSLARFGLRSVSRVIVFTPGEVEQYRRMLSLAPDQITYCPHGWYDAMAWYDPDKRKKSESLARAGKYIFASGRSYRDYETLAHAVAGTDVQVQISGKAFSLKGVDLPSNMQTTGWLNYRDYQDYLYESDFYVVPLQHIAHAGGDSSILAAMSFGKAVVATRAPSTETYVRHGETGLLVGPHDVAGMREAIVRLWRDPDEARRMGRAARRAFEENHTIDKLAQRIAGVTHDVYRAQLRRG